MEFSEHFTVAEARDIYFEKTGFSEAAYSDNWVSFPVGPFKMALPNFSARKKAIPLHDIDHVLTGYQTDWPGECEISAFEIGSGCRHYWAAWFINLQGLLMGLFICPGRVLRAFTRGRRSKGVYGQVVEEMLTQKVGELRSELTIPIEEVRVALADFLSLCTFLFLSAAINLLLPLIVGIYLWAVLF